MLQDLNSIVKNLKDQLSLFSGLDCQLPSRFKQLVTKIGNDTLSYGETTTLVVNSFGQKIYISNNWFYIAAYLSPLYIPFEEYRKTLLRIVDKDILKSKDKEKITANILSSDNLTSDDKANLVLFATDYSWWTAGAAKDGKSLDRGDCLTSAVLAIANVVNNSQSYIATLWNYFGENPSVAALLNEQFSAYQSVMTTCLSEKKLNLFVYKVFSYLESKEELHYLTPFMVESKGRYRSEGTMIKFASEDFPETCVGILIETTLDDIKARNSVATTRWFEDPIKIAGKTVYVSNQWNETGTYPLTLPEFKKFIDVAYNGRFVIGKDENNYFTLSEISSPKNKMAVTINGPLQQIFYGAPGTGKSHGIDEETKGQKVIRTTFHPDSDYSTFVGAYKPVMREVPTMTVIGTKSVAVEDKEGNAVVEKKIEYDFIPQAFTEAYVEAWKDLKKPVYLVIEEINRGNCAQIFGDIFQLLDRDDRGFSSYMISPDEDLHRYLEETFAKKGFDEDCSLDKSDILEIWEGKKMCLPPTLYIWATMNTSDQSLFPIDSAFKRRWDWKYTPISDAGKGYRIDVNGNSYDWWSFLEKVNVIVEEMTSSEDKQLGYFFCKAENGVITAEKFVGKVIFYLWNDVFKDYGFDRDEFKYEEDGKKKPLTFRKFFMADGKINEEMAEKFLTNLKLTAIIVSDQSISQEEEDAIAVDGGKKEGKHDFIKAVTLDGFRLSTEDMTHFDVYLETLRRIGIAQAAPLIESCKFKRRNSPLASTVKYDAIENAQNYSYVEEDGYYFVKGAADETLINVLNMLKTELSLDLEIEIYR